MVDSDAFREVMGTFATGVTVVTLPAPPHGITVNAFASVSLDPPLVLVSIDHDTETHERLSGADDAYCVNVLAADQRHLGEHFAGMDQQSETPFDTDPTRTAATGAPVFEAAAGFVDCTLHESVTAGDHTLYLGAVEAAEVLRPEATVLTFFRGEWGSIE